jgi:hypothetical protein
MIANRLIDRIYKMAGKDHIYNQEMRRETGRDAKALTNEWGKVVNYCKRAGSANL